MKAHQPQRAVVVEAGYPIGLDLKAKPSHLAGESMTLPGSTLEVLRGKPLFLLQKRQWRSFDSSFDRWNRQPSQCRQAPQTRFPAAHSPHPDPRSKESDFVSLADGASPSGSFPGPLRLRARLVDGRSTHAGMLPHAIVVSSHVGSTPRNKLPPLETGPTFWHDSTIRALEPPVTFVPTTEFEDMHLAGCTRLHCRMEHAHGLSRSFRLFEFHRE